MSATEDCELQDLVKQTLEKTGSLSKIRAELRANIFLALEENGSFQDINSKNNELQNFSRNEDGALVLCLIKEFLEFFGLSFTISVFDPELASHNVQCSWKSRNELLQNLKLPMKLENEKKSPIIYHILQQYLNKGNDVLNSICDESEIQEKIMHSPVVRLVDCASLIPINRPTESKVDSSNENSDEVEEIETEPSRTSSDAVNFEGGGDAAPQIKTDKNLKGSFTTDLSKPNLTSLGDLPPLSQSANNGKPSQNVTNKSTKQMSKLKAMLKDTSSEILNPSTGTDDEWENSIEEQNDLSGLDDLDENEIQNLLRI